VTVATPALPTTLAELVARSDADLPDSVGVLGCRGDAARAVVEAIRELGVERVVVFEDDAGAGEAVDRWLAGELDLLLKLETSTATLMREVLRRSRGRWFAHVGLVMSEAMGRAFLVADAGLNRSPSVEDLGRIVDRAVVAAGRLGCSDPTVALIAHRETADPAVPGSLVLEEVRVRYGDDLRRRGVTLIGPMALDVALDDRAASTKDAALAAPCDIVIAPDIIVGNVIYKAFMLRDDCTVAGVALDGAGGAIAVPSRAASASERIASLAFASAVADRDAVGTAAGGRDA
jgi:phosphotransacetylase